MARFVGKLRQLLEFASHYALGCLKHDKPSSSVFDRNAASPGRSDDAVAQKAGVLSHVLTADNSDSRPLPRKRVGMS